MGFKYKENDIEVSRKHASNKGDYDSPLSASLEVFTAAEGKNRLRILPRTWTDDEGPRHWAYRLFIHYNVGPDKGQYACSQKMGKGDCPVCEERVRLEAEGDDDGAKKLRPSMTQLVWVVDRNKEDAGPQLFKMPSTKLEGPICDLAIDEDTKELMKIDHPEEGHDISFTRTGTGLKTEYSAAKVLPKQSYLSEDEKEQDEWLDFIEANPLPGSVVYYGYDYINRVFGGSARRKAPEEEPAATEEETDEAPTRTRRSSSSSETKGSTRRKSRATSDEDELDSGDSEGNDDGEDQASSSGRRSSRRSSRGDSDLRDEVESGLKPRKRTRSRE
jgi:hypothetical protein